MDKNIGPSVQPISPNIESLHDEIRRLIETAKAHVVTQVNQALVLTYWKIGKLIKTEILRDDRAEYGDATIKRLAEKLAQEYGSGFGQRNLFRMAQFYQQFPSHEILTTVSAQLSWSHFVELIKLERNRYPMVGAAPSPPSKKHLKLVKKGLIL